MTFLVRALYHTEAGEAVNSRIPSKYFAFFRIPHCILTTKGRNIILSLKNGIISEFRDLVAIWPIFLVSLNTCRITEVLQAKVV